MSQRNGNYERPRSGGNRPNQGRPPADGRFVDLSAPAPRRGSSPNRPRRCRTPLVLALLLAVVVAVVVGVQVSSCTPYPPLKYDINAIQDNGQVKTYASPSGQQSRFGVDVSYHNGVIDWQALAQQGVQFAYVRVAWRGYTVGEVQEDPMARYNIAYAKGAGIDVGAYVFSQAITEEEAREEADFACDMVDAYELGAYPVAFDMEENNVENERIAHLTTEERTRIALAFCERVRERGYEPMVYGNNAWLDGKFDLVALSQNCELWFAEYRPQPTVKYNFRIWQYSNAGQFEGVDTTFDLNIMFPVE